MVTSSLRRGHRAAFSQTFYLMKLIMKTQTKIARTIPDPLSVRSFDASAGGMNHLLVASLTRIAFNVVQASIEDLEPSSFLRRKVERQISRHAGASLLRVSVASSLFCIEAECISVDPPSECLRAVAMMQIDVKNGDPVHAMCEMGMCSGDDGVVDPAKALRCVACAVVTWWSREKESSRSRQGDIRCVGNV